jgi:hypothetical protein
MLSIVMSGASVVSEVRGIVQWRALLTPRAVAQRKDEATFDAAV